MSSRLEEYLEEVSRPLPPEERPEWRAEVEEHLEAMIAGYEELGHSREEAVEWAIERFGDPKKLGRRVGVEAARTAAVRDRQPLPLSLKVVAGLYMWGGCHNWCELLAWLLEIGTLRFSDLLGASFLFIGIGLLQRRPACHRFAVAYSWFFLFVLVIAGGTLLLKFYGASLTIWKLWVLTRPGVRSLFVKAAPRRCRAG